MSVESGGCLATSVSPSNSLSVAASPAASTTGTVVRSTALGVTYEADDPGARAGSPEPTPATTASALLRIVKQGVESEEEGRKRRGRGGGGKREKNGKFINANKQLMKKGILEFDSRAGGGDRASTLPHTSSSTPRQHNHIRPLSVYTTSPPNNFPTDVAPSDLRPGGVLVAGAGGSMRRVYRDQSPTDVLPYPGNSVQLAFSPDSGYGNTPDGMRHSDQQSQHPQPTNTTTATATLNLPQNGSSRSNSERTSSSDSVGMTVALDSGTAVDSSTSFCGANMSMPHPVKFGIGEAVNTVFPPVQSPTSTAAPTSSRAPSSSESSRDKKHKPDSCVTQSIGGAPDRLPTSTTSPQHYNPYSINFSFSPGPTGQAQQFQFATLPDSSMTHGISTPSLSSLPPTIPRHTHHSPSRPHSSNHRSRDGETPDNSRRQTSPAHAWRDRSRQIRSRSQPMVASLSKPTITISTLTLNKPYINPLHSSHE